MPLFNNMNQNNEEYYFDESLGRQPYSFTLGLKELLFLGLMFFFGFCGFSVCVEKIYAQKSDNTIEDVTVHNIDISSVEPVTLNDVYDELVSK